MWVSGGLHVSLFGALSLLVFVMVLQDPEAGSSIFAEGAAQVYATGSWWDQVRARPDHSDERVSVPARHPSDAFRRRILRWGLLLGVPLNMLYFVPNALFELPVRYLFAPVLSLGYIGLVALLTERGILPWLSARAAEVGRMGLWLTGRIGTPATLAIWACICAAITLFSHLWLGRFASGPLELVWKRLSSLPFEAGKKR
jgi:uncharacterized protein